MISLKVCTKCGEEKNLHDFSKSGFSKSTGKQLYRPDCKECSRLYSRTFYKDNIETLRERHRNSYYKYKDRIDRYREENRESLLEYHRNYYIDNRESNLLYGRDYRLKNRETILVRDRTRKRANPELNRKLSSRRRAKKKSLYWDDVPDSELISRDGLICGWCSCTLPEDLSGVHRDHIIPLSRGGFHIDFNMTLSCDTCDTCNLRKGSKDPLDFVKEAENPSVYVLRQLDLHRLSRETQPECLSVVVI